MGKGSRIRNARNLRNIPALHNSLDANIHVHIRGSKPQKGGKVSEIGDSKLHDETMTKGGGDMANN